MIHSATTPIGTLTKKISRHENQCTISPPTVGPSSGPISAGMMTKFIATSSSDLGNVRMMASRPTGVIIAAPKPCRMRAATSIGTLTASPQSTDASGEQRDGGSEHAARAIAVGDPAADRDAHRQAQDVAGDDRLEAQRRHAEADRHRRDRRVDDRRVELLHEQRGGDDPRQVALDRRGVEVGGGRWGRGHGAAIVRSSLPGQSDTMLAEA